MNLLIHDLPVLHERIVPERARRDTTIIAHDSGTHAIHACKGCFDCWVKTPAHCNIRDDHADMGRLLAESERLILISQCCYGGYSPFISRVLGRSIAYILPYFVTRNGQFHHPGRYDHTLDFKVHLYGETTTREQETARKLVERNSINLLLSNVEVHFYATPDDIGAVA
jgi:multimeric flavodoxin WrbA